MDLLRLAKDLLRPEIGLSKSSMHLGPVMPKMAPSGLSGLAWALLDWQNVFFFFCFFIIQALLKKGEPNLPSFLFWMGEP